MFSVLQQLDTPTPHGDINSVGPMAQWRSASSLFLFVAMCEIYT
jgi:hypothetical protein